MKYILFIIFILFSYIEADTVGVDMQPWIVSESGEVINSNNLVDEDDMLVANIDSSFKKPLHTTQESKNNLDQIPLAVTIPVEEFHNNSQIKESKEHINRATIASTKSIANENIEQINKKIEKLSKNIIKEQTLTIITPQKVSTIKKREDANKNIIDTIYNFLRPLIEFVKNSPKQFVLLILMITILVYTLLAKLLFKRVQNYTQSIPLSS